MTDKLDKYEIKYNCRIGDWEIHKKHEACINKPEQYEITAKDTNPKTILGLTTMMMLYEKFQNE